MTTDPPSGAGALEVNQGDYIIGEISRADVAKICIAALDAEDTNNVTFELFETGRR